MMMCLVFLVCSVGQGKKYAVQIEPVVGELLRPISISEQGFLALQGRWWDSLACHPITPLPPPPAEKLRGMHEVSGKLTGPSREAADATSAVLEVTNLAQVPHYP